MIPPADQPLTHQQKLRWDLTKLAAALVHMGVPVALVMQDAKQGCDMATRPDPPPPSTVGATVSGWPGPEPQSKKPS